MKVVVVVILIAAVIGLNFILCTAFGNSQLDFGILKTE